MLARSFSPSKLKLFRPLSLFIECHIKPSLSHLPSTRDSPTKPSQNPTSSSFFSFSPKIFRSFSSNPNPDKPSIPFTRDGNFDETASQGLLICQGCGVHMQDSHPKQPGFFITPSVKGPNYKLRGCVVAEDPSIPNILKRGMVFGSERETPSPENPNPETPSPETPSPETPNTITPSPKIPGPDPSVLVGKPVVCARCHSLRYYGKVKDAAVENLLPDFDFYRTVGRRLASAKGVRAVVMMVVDAVDFDGSFPHRVAKLVSATIDENQRAWKEGRPANVPRVVLVVTKIDLLPSSLSPTGLEHWVRQRARAGGANRITSVHLVSPVKGWGLLNLIDEVCALAGPKGHVWAIGAQNAGKSTLLNSIGKAVGGKILHLTEARVPGTTLGIVRVEGVLSGEAKLFDTPGLLQPFQITTRLTPEEQRLVHISKEVKPRTYRIKAGHSIHIAGLIRLDIEDASTDSIYVTVWASHYLPLHMGKTENACRMLEEHFGRQLQPPIGEKRVEELGKWERKEFRVCGRSWDVCSVDIAAAGLGWFAVGLKGEAVLGVWTCEGVGVVVRNSLIPHRSRLFQVPGFTASDVVSKADQAQSNSEKGKTSDPKGSKADRAAKKKKRKPRDPEVTEVDQALLEEEIQ